MKKRIFPKKEFICNFCHKTFLAGSNCHCHWCPDCRYEQRKLLIRKNYWENVPKYLDRAVKSRKKFMSIHGISRPSLIEHGMTPLEYDKLRKKGCYVCGFKDVLDIHRLIWGKNENLLLLCPNHHALVHRKGFSLEKVTKYGN